MKKYFPYRSIILFCLVWAVVTLSSCIKDERSGCQPRFPGLSVTFTDPYQNGDLGWGLNTDEFMCVRLFIYDVRGQLVTTARLYDCKLDEPYRLDAELAPGNYDMVVWVGAETILYNLEHTENLEMASLSLQIPKDHQINFWISPLYFGKSSFKVASADETVIVDMVQYTNDIYYTVTGLENDRLYSFWIVDDNGKYSFKDAFMPCEMFGYHSDPLFFSVDRFKSRMTMMRLREGRNPVLILMDDLTGEIIYPSYKGQETNLINLIKSAYQDKTHDFEARHIYELSFIFDPDKRARVFIDNWEVKENNYEI